MKGYHSIQYRTLFGIVNLSSPRFIYCQCHNRRTKHLVHSAIGCHDKNSPELQYIETKWASLISFEQTANLLKDVLPVGETENAVNNQKSPTRYSKKAGKRIRGKTGIYFLCQNELDKFPKPDKPITVGIDGGYLKNWKNKNNNFEIIAGKSFSKTQTPKRFGFIQKM